jgi:hypothetical protein
VILARRKSGKTAFVQRIFNQLWTQNGPVIPFYFSFDESKIWYPDLAIKYYCAFASQYIAFLERDEELVRTPLSLEAIHDIQHKLIMMSEADVIERGSADIDFHGLQDGTLNLILRHRLEKEINGFQPDLKQAFNEKLAEKSHQLQGQLNQLSGYFAEYQLAIAFRIKFSRFHAEVSLRETSA